MKHPLHIYLNKISIQNNNDVENKYKECPICNENIDLHTSHIQLPCHKNCQNNTYHYDCIHHWFQLKVPLLSCPYCQTFLTDLRNVEYKKIIIIEKFTMEQIKIIFDYSLNYYHLKYHSIISYFCIGQSLFVSLFLPKNDYNALFILYNMIILTFSIDLLCSSLIEYKTFILYLGFIYSQTYILKPWLKEIETMSFYTLNGCLNHTFYLINVLFYFYFCIYFMIIFGCFISFKIARNINLNESGFYDILIHTIDN